MAFYLTKPREFNICTVKNDLNGANNRLDRKAALIRLMSSNNFLAQFGLIGSPQGPGTAISRQAVG